MRYNKFYLIIHQKLSIAKINNFFLFHETMCLHIGKYNCRLVYWFTWESGWAESEQGMSFFENLQYQYRTTIYFCWGWNFICDFQGISSFLKMICYHIIHHFFAKIITFCIISNMLIVWNARSSHFRNFIMHMWRLWITLFVACLAVSSLQILE